MTIKPGHTRSKQKKNDTHQTGIIGPPNDQGETQELHGHTYNVGVQNQADLLTTTKKKLAIYSSRNCREPKDIRLAIEESENVTFTMPTRRPELDSSIANIVLSKDIDFISRNNPYISRTR